MEDSPALAVPCLVLDTNVVLDWLVFRNVQVLELAAQLREGQVRWLATPAMRDEFDLVLARDALRAAWQPDVAEAARCWALHACMQAGPVHPAPWRCKDPSDQQFVDLAVAANAQALLTRDRRLLELARRARLAGLSISTPEAWLARHTAL